ncbi:hypothetical protein ANI_1_1100164 [Paecilomyces variotii No. 5]|uniref:Rhodopsin domain-containing protein n=1 Tax=Byssochlamys spectabilis (strain No. 5 / NBRC 109023) TaxID=1356009 RepID=V5G5T4_BYSSN|nr:hypothetical protein ANI_1_1100164 [Paecilomyces variotii No. 5]
MTIEIDPAIVEIFGQSPTDLDLSTNNVSKNDIAVIILLVIATTAVVLRFIARVTLRNAFMADDWCIMLALLFVGTTGGLSIAGGKFGAGKHILYAYTFVYAAACCATKISILFFYWRLFAPSSSDRLLRWSIAFCFFLALSYPIIIWITMANCCRPVSFYWTQFSGAKGKCIDVKKFFVALGIINMLNDIMVLAVGFPPILKLQMSRRKKTAVCGIMLLGSFVCIASIVRIYYLSEFTKAIDVTWLMGPVFIWSTIEPCIGIVCACLPHLSPLAKLAGRKLSSSFGSSTQPSYPTTKPRSHSRPTLGAQNRSRLFSFPDRKHGTESDEIGLTNYVVATSHGQTANSVGSEADENNIKDDRIFVQSSFVQSVSQT